MQAISSIIRPIGTFTKWGVGAFISYTVIESALSNLLGLHTLRDGTNLTAWWNIQLMGLDPNKAVREGKGCHMFADVFGSPVGDIYPEKANGFHRFVNTCGRQRLLFPIVKRTASWGHGVMRGAGAWRHIGPSWARYPMMSFGALIGFLTPVIQVHITPNEVSDKFERAESHGGHMRLRTKEQSQIVVSTQYLGILGALRQGFKDGWKGIWLRTKDDPTGLLLGTAQLAALLWVATMLTRDCSRISGAVVGATSRYASPAIIRYSTIAAGFFAYMSR